MSLLKIGNYLIDSRMISLIELYASKSANDDRVSIYLPRVGRGGVVGIGGSLHFEDADQIFAIRTYFNNPDNSEIEITFVTKPEPIEGKEEELDAYEIDIPF